MAAGVPRVETIEYYIVLHPVLCRVGFDCFGSRSTVSEIKIAEERGPVWRPWRVVHTAHPCQP